MTFHSVLIIGGSSGLGTASAFTFTQNGANELILVSRDSEYFRLVVSDLQIRLPDVKVHAYGFTDNFVSIIELVLERHEFQVCLITLGTMIETSSIQLDLGLIHKMNYPNMDMVAISAEMVGRELASRGGGHLAIFGSVAGDRGRAINYHYGASKAYLEALVEGLAQRFYVDKVKVSIIKPGPSLTRMTEKLENKKSKFALPEIVAKDIVKGIKRRKQVIYAPKKWRLIMLIIRIIPRKLFNLMEF